MDQDRATTALASVLAGGRDWERLDAETLASVAEAAAWHGAEPLLWTALAGVAPAAAVRESLAPAMRAAVARELFMQRELERVTSALAAAGVAALITKGAALAYSVYPEPWMRPRVDTDLLVRLGDVPSAAQVLEQCGYARSDATNTGALVSHQVAWERTDPHGVDHVLDLHWKIANPQVLADAVGFDDLWPRAIGAPALGPAARVPGTVESIAIACVHRLAHHQARERLIWLYDLKLLTAALDRSGWADLRELACSRMIAGVCLDGLRTARVHVGASLPEDVEAALAAAAPAEPSHGYLEGELSKSDVLISDLKALRSWSDRVRLVREHVFPPAAFMQQRYRTRTRLLLPALYVHRLVAGASKWVKS